MAISEGDLITTINRLDTLPLHLYLKDKEGIYCGRNYYAAEQMHEHHFETKTSKIFVLDKTDYDLFDYKTARQFRKNDQEILKRNQSAQFIEELLLPDGQITQMLSIKTPFISQTGKSFILGCTISLNQVPPAQVPAQLTLISCILDKQKLKGKFIQLMASFSKPLLSEIVATFRQLSIYYSDPPQLKNLALMSERQLQCLCFLCRGYSAKQIAHFLNISSRTVEIFINQLKVKLNCHNKSQMVDWLWNLLSGL